jgi:hypothetical protein
LKDNEKIGYRWTGLMNSTEHIIRKNFKISEKVFKNNKTLFFFDNELKKPQNLSKRPTLM